MQNMRKQKINHTQESLWNVEICDRNYTQGGSLKNNMQPHRALVTTYSILKARQAYRSANTLRV